MSGIKVVGKGFAKRDFVHCHCSNLVCWFIFLLLLWFVFYFAQLKEKSACGALFC